MKILLTVTLALLSLSTLAAQERGITLSVSDPTVSVVREGTRYRLERQSELLPGDQLITNAGETSALIGEDVLYTLRKGLRCSLGADSLRMVNIEAGAMRIVHGGGELVTIANPLFEATVSEAIAKFHVGDSVKVWCEQGTVSLNLLVEQQVAQSDAKSILKRVAWQQASIELSAGEAIEISPDGKHEGPYKSLDDAQDSLGLLAGIGKARQATVELLAMNQPGYNPSTATQQLPSQVAQTQQAPAGDRSSTPQVGQQYVSTLASLNIGFGGGSSSSALASGSATADANQRTLSFTLDANGVPQANGREDIGGFLFDITGVTTRPGTDSIPDAVVDGVPVLGRTAADLNAGSVNDFNGGVYAITDQRSFIQNIGVPLGNVIGDFPEYWSIADTTIPLDTTLDPGDMDTGDGTVNIRAGVFSPAASSFTLAGQRITPELVVDVPDSTLRIVGFGSKLADSDPLEPDTQISSLLAVNDGTAVEGTPQENVRIGQGLRDSDSNVLNENLTYALGQVRLKDLGGGKLEIAIRRSDQDRILEQLGNAGEPTDFERANQFSGSQTFVTPNGDVTYRSANADDIPGDALFDPFGEYPDGVPLVEPLPGRNTPDRLPATFSRRPSLENLAPNGQGKKVMTMILGEALKGLGPNAQTRFVVDGQLIDITGYPGR